MTAGCYVTVYAIVILCNKVRAQPTYSIPYIDQPSWVYKDITRRSTFHLVLMLFVSLLIKYGIPYLTASHSAFSNTLFI